MKHYAEKLAEAEREGLTSKKTGKRHLLQKGKEEMFEGFNQRPGGRVDMVMDGVPGVQGIKWPHALPRKSLQFHSSPSPLSKTENAALLRARARDRAPVRRALPSLSF